MKTLHHLEEQEWVLSEQKRVIKKMIKSHCWISDWSGKKRSKLEKKKKLVVKNTKEIVESIKDQVESIGFSSVEDYEWSKLSYADKGTVALLEYIFKGEAN